MTAAVCRRIAGSAGGPRRSPAARNRAPAGPPGRTSAPTSGMAPRAGCRGDVRGATRRGEESHADLGILGLLTRVDVHDVVRGVVDVHGFSRDELALRAPWRRPSS